MDAGQLEPAPRRLEQQVPALRAPAPPPARATRRRRAGNGTGGASRPSIALTNASANVRPRPSASPTARISAPSARLGQRELLEVEPRRLDRDVVERRLERGRRLAGDVVRQLVEREADREQRRELRDREAGRLRRERRRARDARVHLDHAELVRLRVHRELHVRAAGRDARPRARSRTPPRAAAGRRGRAASAAARSSTSRRCARPSGRGSRSSRRRPRCRARRTSPRARAPASPRGTPRRAPGRPGSRRCPSRSRRAARSRVCATPPPRPPSVNAGRTIAGTGNSTSASVRDDRVRHRQADALHRRRGRARGPRRGGSRRGRRRSARPPSGASSTARLSAVCPPSVGRIASGRSRSITSATVSGVERLEVGRVGPLGVGHDRRRVRVDEHDAVALAPQHAAGLRPRVVELARLPDADRAGAEDQDRAKVGALRHASASRSKKGSASSGPGEASGWNWTLAKPSPASPSQVPSFSETCEMSPLGDHREAVVLHGHEHAAGLDVAHGMVRAAVAERELERLVAEREPEQLVAEADAEERDRGRAARGSSRSGRRTSAGSPGPFADQHDARVGLEDRVRVPRRRARRSASTPVAASRRGIELFDAEVDDDDARARRRPSTARSSTARAASGLPSMNGSASARSRQLLDRRVAERAAQHAAVADLAHERARVDRRSARRRRARAARRRTRAARRASRRPRTARARTPSATRRRRTSRSADRRSRAPARRSSGR